MSARSMARAHERELNRERRRWTRRAKRAGVGAAAAIGASIALAPAANAANFVVNSNNDAAQTPCDATCTLRDAVGAANADATLDTITFAPSVTGEIEINGGLGQIDIEAATTIQGPGAGVLALDGYDASGLLGVDTDVVGAPYDPVKISGLTLRNGAGQDGAALVTTLSDTTLDSVAVRSNTPANGAIYADGGSLTVLGSTFAANAATSDGGAIYTDDDNAINGDGQSKLIVRDSTFVGNTAATSGGRGGAIYVGESTDSVVITGSTFTGNNASYDGGGILIEGAKTGAIRIENSTITGNNAGDDGGGIAILSKYDRPVAIANSTISGNVAGDTGGGVFNNAIDGESDPGSVDDVSVSSSIVAGNQADVGPDLGTRVPQPMDDPATGSFVTGFSLIGNPAGALISESPAGSNLLGADPQLGGLADNGGPTKTMLPAETSPAVDAGIANGLTVDQRGLPRTVRKRFTLPPGGDGTDIGAVELQDEGLAGVTVEAEKKQQLKGKKVVITVLAGADEDVKATGSGSVKAGKAKSKLKKVTKTVTGGKLAKLKLVPKSKKASKAIAAAIKDGKKGKAKLKVTLTDPAGNTVTEKPKVTLKG